MPLEVPPAILVGMVVTGVPLVVGLTWAFGWARGAILDAPGARARFALDHPDLEVAAVHLSDDRRAALVVLADAGPAGVVWAVGDRLATRRVGKAWEVEEAPDGVVVHTGDFGAPRIHVRLEPASRARWRAALADGGPVGAA